MDNKLAEPETKYRQLSHQLIQLTEQERQRIARAIHDQIGQSLVALKMEIKAAQRQLDSDPVALARQLQSADKLIDDAVTIVRRIAAELRPDLLDHFGLSAAVEWQMEQFKEGTQIPYQLDLDIDPEKITPDMAIVAFRILQEALAEVVPPAQSSTVFVKLTTVEKQFVMLVQKNGGRFDQNSPPYPPLVLLGMSERAQLVDGSVTVRADQALDVMLTLTLPIRADDKGTMQ